MTAPLRRFPASLTISGRPYRTFLDAVLVREEACLARDLPSDYSRVGCSSRLSSILSQLAPMVPVDSANFRPHFVCRLLPFSCCYSFLSQEPQPLTKSHWYFHISLGTVSTPACIIVILCLPMPLTLPSLLLPLFILGSDFLPLYSLTTPVLLFSKSLWHWIFTINKLTILKYYSGVCD